MKHQFSQGTFNPDGSWTMPAGVAKRWLRLMSTSYAGLTEHERESDRAEADRTLAAIDAHVLECVLEHAPRKRRGNGEG